MTDGKSLVGRVAIVTGGSSGIGRATASLLASEGAKVAIFALDPQRGHEVVAELEASGGTARFYRCDVANEADVAASVSGVLSDWGQLDLLVNNAGGGGPYTESGAGRYGSTVDMLTEAQWDFVINKNLKGCFLCSKYAVRHFKERRSGVVINVVSGAGLKGVIYQSAYAAAKHGMVGLTKVMALDLGRYGIRVNAVSPGQTDTPALRRAALSSEVRQGGGTVNVEELPLPETLPDGFRATVTRQIPLRRVGEAEDIAQAILFLASDAARHITGVVLPVDGGGMAH